MVGRKVDMFEDAAVYRRKTRGHHKNFSEWNDLTSASRRAERARYKLKREEICTECDCNWSCKMIRGHDGDTRCIYGQERE